jgi:thioredoxin reductase (NADPH)
VSVVLYTAPGCGYCARARELLDGRGVDYRQIDVTSDRAAEREMIARSGGRTTVPQIFVHGRHVGGYDELAALAESGGLDGLSAAAAGPAAERRAADEPDRARERAEDTEVHEVIILGSGPAGLTAAIYCARANLRPLVVEGLSAGGQLMGTTDVENYPGFPEGLQGPEMMELFKRQASRFGSRFVSGDATGVELGSRPFRVRTDEREFAARALIIATGASPRTLGVAGEKEHAGRGVSYCATCDGFFFRGQEIVVVGGVDTAMEEALFLTRFGSRVSVVHRRDELRASKIMADRALAHPKIEFVWNAVVDEVLGGDGGKVGSIRLRDVRSGATSVRPCAGLFVAIGHVPNTAMFRGRLPMDEQGYLKVIEAGSRTVVPGVFVAGDVHDHVYRQAVTAAGAGCRAAIDCERWLEGGSG